jgi:hypothetical protein
LVAVADLQKVKLVLEVVVLVVAVEVTLVGKQTELLVKAMRAVA